MVVFPVFMVLVLIGIQFGLTMHARAVLVAAAQDGATDAARAGAPPGAGDDTARALVDAGARRLTSDVAVTTARQGGRVTVTVSAQVQSVVGFLHPHLVARSTAPVERFVPEGQR